MDVEMAVSYFVAAACSSLKSGVNIAWSIYLFILGAEGTSFIWKRGLACCPGNKKAEISPFFFSVHLHMEDQTANFKWNIYQVSTFKDFAKILQ